jgi:hypothetical protein
MDQTKTCAGTSAPIVGAADKPLGRGLEDVSHLFFSQRRNEAPGSDRASGRSPQLAHPQSGSQAHTVLLQPNTSVTRDQLATMLWEAACALEEGLRAIDACIPCPPCGEIDFLALDRTNQLTIIDFDTTPNDGLLLRGIGHFDWIVRNIANVRRMYAGRAINFSVPPRLFLLAPQFSLLLRSVTRHIGRPRMNWVRYHVVDVSGEHGILFEHVVGE